MIDLPRLSLQRVEQQTARGGYSSTSEYVRGLIREDRDRREQAALESKLLEGLATEDFARTAWHPRLNVSMRLVDHLLFIAEHDDHHLARIWELRRKKPGS